MNRDCGKYVGLIEDLIEEKLDLQKTAQAESHLLDCSECRNEHEFLRQEKEVLAHYLFEFEPPHNSWANFQPRLINENKPLSGDPIFPANPARQRKRIFAFYFSPVFAAAAVLLLFFGIVFVSWINATFEKTTDEYAAATKPENSQSPQINKSDKNPATAPQIQTAGSDDEVSKNKALPVGNVSLKAEDKFLARKKDFLNEPVKIKAKSVSSSGKKRKATETQSNTEELTATLQKRNLEIEVAGHIEKIELLLRSFRNAREIESDETFDVAYERIQARKLLEANAQLRRDAEAYRIAYGEELLNRVEPYLLEIANLGDNPAPDRVLEIRARVSSQNIIAGLQVYNSGVAAR